MQAWTGGFEPPVKLSTQLGAGRSSSWVHDKPIDDVYRSTFMLLIHEFRALELQHIHKSVSIIYGLLVDSHSDQLPVRLIH